ncbi:hypothetical protein ACFO5X_26105, partial [Seohaeicola nanhaiensis]
AYFLKFNNFIRGMKTHKNVKPAPHGTNWAQAGDQNDRLAGIYLSENINHIMEDIFIDQSGWADGYLPNGDGASPMLPTQFSHCIYGQHSSLWQTARRIFLSRGALNGGQFRSGFIGLNVITMDNQWQILISRGGGEAKGNYSLLDNYVGTVGGGKAFWNGTAGQLVGNVNNGGIVFGFTKLAGLDRAVIGNDELPRATLPTLINSTSPPGPVGLGGSGSSGSSLKFQSGATLAYSFLQRFNWGSEDDLNVEGIEQVVLDGTTAGAFYDFLTGGSGGTHLDLINRWLAMDDPWGEYLDYIRWTRGRLGNDVTVRTTPKTLNFLPNARQHTPGNRASIELDWHPNGLDGLPGDVVGDSVDIGEHVITWDIIPRNQIEDFTMRKGAGMRVVGLIDIAGDITADVDGNLFSVYGGGRVMTSGYDGANPIFVDLADGRYVNSGIVTGGVSIAARHRSEVILGYDDATFTVGPDDTLTVYGESLVGVDGAVGGTAALILQGTLALKPTLRLVAGTVPTAFSSYHGYDFPVIANRSCM